MKPDEKDSELSELELAIQKRERKMFPCQLPDVLGMSGKSLGEVLLRVPTVAEQEKAIVESNKYIQEKSKETPNVMSDPDFFQNVKTAHILHKVCFVKSKEGFKPRAAFKSPAWMIENLGAMEIGALLDAYNEVIRSASNNKSKFSPENLRALAKYCHANTASKEPNEFLSKMSYEDVSEALVLMSIMYHEASSGQMELADKSQEIRFTETKELK